MFYFLRRERQAAPPTGPIPSWERKRKSSASYWTQFCLDFICYARNTLIILLTLLCPLPPVTPSSHKCGHRNPPPSISPRFSYFNCLPTCHRMGWSLHKGKYNWWRSNLALSRNFTEMLFLVTTVNIYQYKHNTWNRQTYYRHKSWWVHNPCCYVFWEAAIHVQKAPRSTGGCVLGSSSFWLNDSKLLYLSGCCRFL